VQNIRINRYGMESVNVMAKISHGCGSVGSIRSQRRRIVSEPTDSLVSFYYWSLFYFDFNFSIHFHRCQLILKVDTR
jgi:hypothetical protein